MRGGMWLGGLALLAAAQVVAADEARRLTDTEFRRELTRNDRMAAYVDRNGMPDVAERRFLSDRPPWDHYEIVLSYLGPRRQIAFARAYILGQPWISMIRFERSLSAADVSALESQPTRYTALDDRKDLPRDPATQAEASARRAEDAAARVEAAADVTERAADRAEAVVAKLQLARASRRGR